VVAYHFLQAGIVCTLTTVKPQFAFTSIIQYVLY